MSTKALMMMSEKEMRNARVRGIFSRIKTSVVVAMTTMMLSMMFAMAAFAEDTTEANNYVEQDTKEAWNKVMDLIIDWVPRIGVVIIVIGAIEFGFAFKSEDAEGKTKALRTIAAGAIVGGVVFGIGGLMKI